ncbi:protein translocase subunit SecF [Frigoribacterium sp. UYMn621]|jgi:preprotein translocase subunit SecF|uniref:protein translocase subunit SecF n=1 Tax=Frigoribacterium sp. UYMn621 TaxID=3156343 RepID=UPI0033966B88
MASFSQFGNDLYTGKRSYDIIGKRKIWYGISAVLILIVIVVPIFRGGFLFGIEFLGGSQFQISSSAGLDSTKAQTLAQDTVLAVEPGSNPRVTLVGSASSVRVQTDQLTSSQSVAIQQALAKAYNIKDSEVTTSFIGATWGQDITRQALTGLIVFVILAAIVMALYFRTWKMSVAAITALLHDLVIVAGVYGVFHIEVTPAAVIGFLTILGYSLYDTVVVFDKIRENTGEDGAESRRTFAESVNLAVNQTLVRSINTSVVAILPVGSILFIGAFVLGAGTLKDISLALFIGIIVGTYSTIFIAAPLYAQLRSGEEAIKKRDKRTLTVREASIAPVK